MTCSRPLFPYACRSLLLCLIVCWTSVPRLCAQSHTDDELLDLGIEAYDEHRFLPALKLLYAYQERAPALLQENEAFATELQGAIDFSQSSVEEEKAALMREVKRLREQLAALGAPVTIVQGLKLPPPPLARPDTPASTPPAAGVLSEDCIGFDATTLRLRPRGERWIMQSSSSSMKAFPNEQEARQAIRTLLFYDLDTHCFVGRPDPSLEYFLVENQAPEGSIGDEDCLSFNPARLSLQPQGERWLLSEGSHRLILFPNQQEARTALALIKRHEFRQACYIGRPDPSMTYLRK